MSDTTLSDSHHNLKPLNLPTVVYAIHLWKILNETEMIYYRGAFFPELNIIIVVKDQPFLRLVECLFHEFIHWIIYRLPDVPLRGTLNHMFDYFSNRFIDMTVYINQKLRNL